MINAPDDSRLRRFWYWFLNGHAVGDQRFRDVEPLPGNVWVWRDEEGKSHVALPAPCEWLLLLGILGGLVAVIAMMVSPIP